MKKKQQTNTHQYKRKVNDVSDTEEYQDAVNPSATNFIYDPVDEYYENQEREGAEKLAKLMKRPKTFVQVRHHCMFTRFVECKVFLLRMKCLVWHHRLKMTNTMIQSQRRKREKQNLRTQKSYLHLTVTWKRMKTMMMKKTLQINGERKDQHIIMLIM